jgi:hypothetical protein
MCPTLKETRLTLGAAQVLLGLGYSRTRDLVRHLPREYMRQGRHPRLVRVLRLQDVGRLQAMRLERLLRGLGPMPTLENSFQRCVRPGIVPPETTLQPRVPLTTRPPIT